MRFLIAILFIAAAQCRNRPGGYVHDPSGDDGEPYVHDPAWDLTPFQLFQLKKKGVSPQSLSQNSIIQPAAPSQPTKLLLPPIKLLLLPIKLLLKQQTTLPRPQDILTPTSGLERMPTRRPNMLPRLKAVLTPTKLFFEDCSVVLGML